MSILHLSFCLSNLALYLPLSCVSHRGWDSPQFAATEQLSSGCFRVGMMTRGLATLLTAWRSEHGPRRRVTQGEQCAQPSGLLLRLPDWHGYGSPEQRCSCYLTDYSQSMAWGECQEHQSTAAQVNCEVALPLPLHLPKPALPVWLLAAARSSTKPFLPSAALLYVF